MVFSRHVQLNIVQYQKPKNQVFIMANNHATVTEIARSRSRLQVELQIHYFKEMYCNGMAMVLFQTEFSKLQTMGLRKL